MDFDCEDTEDSRTIYCGNLASKVTEELLYELFLQAGPLERVNIPIDKDGRPAAYGFITYKHKCSVDYALKLFDGTQLFNCRLNIKPRKQDNNSAPNSPTPHAVQIPLLPTPPPVVLFNVSPNHQAVPLAPVHNNLNRALASARSELYRNNISYINAALQNRTSSYSSKRERDMFSRASNNVNNHHHKHNHKRHKR